MRKAAGILMIIFGVAAIGISIYELSKRRYGFDVYSYSELVIMTELLVLFITGGVFCLKRKYWGLCLTSSIFLHFWVMVPLVDFVPRSWLNSLPPWFPYLSPVTILPFILICLRKREWQAQEFQG